jgi:hypothetical protein
MEHVLPPRMNARFRGKAIMALEAELVVERPKAGERYMYCSHVVTPLGICHN